MNVDSVQTLLEALASGDVEAAERAYREYEPLLRMLVRRRLTPQLRVRFDSIDVVHSVWADLLDGLRANRWHFEDADQLRGFLVRVTSNRFVDRLRQHRTVRQYEQARARGWDPATGPSRADTPSEVAAAGELWERMLAVCPPAYHEILRLRRQGFTTAEIGARVGLNEGSVRRILGGLARRLVAAGSDSPPVEKPGP